MTAPFTDAEVADLKEMRTRFRAQLDDERARLLRVFRETVEAADPVLLLSTAAQANVTTPGSERETAASTIASAIGLPLSDYDPSLLVVLKGFVFARLEELRPQAIGNYAWYF